MGEVMINDYTKRLKPWFHLTVEEKAFIVMKAYRHNILVSDEMRPYLWECRKKNVSNFFFPLIVLPLSSFTFKTVYFYN